MTNMTKPKKPRANWYRTACSTVVKLTEMRRERDDWKAMYNDAAKELNRVKGIISRIKRTADET